MLPRDGCLCEYVLPFHFFSIVFIRCDRQAEWTKKESLLSLNARKRASSLYSSQVGWSGKHRRGRHANRWHSECLWWRCAPTLWSGQRPRIRQFRRTGNYCGGGGCDCYRNSHGYLLCLLPLLSSVFKALNLLISEVRVTIAHRAWAPPPGEDGTLKEGAIILGNQSCR